MSDPKKNALITGASAGLGVEFAHQLAVKGYDLILVARRKEKLEEVAADLKERHGVTVHTFSADLAHPNAPAEPRSACNAIAHPQPEIERGQKGEQPGIIE